VCNLLIRPVNPKHYMTAEQLAREKALQHEDRTIGDAQLAARGNFGLAGFLSWAAIGIPFLIGVYIAAQKAAALF
jgi:hypothetical protein